MRPSSATAVQRAKRVAEATLPGLVMRALRVAKFRLERARFAERVVHHSYGGRELRIVIGSRYGERYDRDWSELQEIAFLKRHRLRPGARVFNLGANHGVVALMLADAVGPEGQVVALEPHPHDASLAKRNQALNGIEHLLCLHAAAARTTGNLPFGVNGEVDDGTGRWGRNRVRSWSIDDLARQHGRPDVVFMDVEGYEQEALAGADETLAAEAVDWFVEVHVGQLEKYRSSVQGVLARFDRTAYDLYVAADGLSFLSDRTVSATAFAPIDEAPPSVLCNRFFLIAVHRA